MECEIQEECVCGTKFQASGSSSFCAARYDTYLKNHKVCLDNKQNLMSTETEEALDKEGQLTDKHGQLIVNDY